MEEERRASLARKREDVKALEIQQKRERENSQAQEVKKLSKQRAEFERQTEARRLSIEAKKAELEEARLEMQREKEIESLKRRNEFEYNEPLDYFQENQFLPEKAKAHSKQKIREDLMKKRGEKYEEPPPPPPKPELDELEDGAIPLRAFFHELDDPMPSFAERGSFSRVSTMPKEELAIERRVMLWELFDEINETDATKDGEDDPASKSAERRMRRTSHKKHNSDAPAPRLSIFTARGHDQQNELYKIKLKEAITKDEALYGAGYWTLLEDKLKKLQSELEGGKGSQSSLLSFAYKSRRKKKKERRDEAEEEKFLLQHSLHYGVLVEVMSRWEGDEMRQKSLAHETSPPRRSSLVKKALQRELIQIEYPHRDSDDPRDFFQQINVSAMTSPAEVVKQFVEAATTVDPAKVRNWSKGKSGSDGVKKSIENQMAERRHRLMTSEVRRTEEAVQGLADRLEALSEIIAYFEETIGGDSDAVPPLDPEMLSEKLREVAEFLLTAKREVRKRQKRRMTISSKAPILPEIPMARGSEKKAKFVEMFNRVREGNIPRMDELFALVDGDGDGSIDEEEWDLFLTVRRETQRVSAEERNKVRACEERRKMSQMGNLLSSLL